MRKLFLSVAIVGITLFTSCAKEPPCNCDVQPDEEPPQNISIADTYWAIESTWGDKYELTFTSSTATYIYKARNGYTLIVDGPYTYYSPTISIAGDSASLKGTVNDDILTIGVFNYGDIQGETVELKKQEHRQTVFPTEPTIIGEWKLTQYGDSLNGDIAMKPSGGRVIYTFYKNCTGWVYNGSNYFQESFRWQRISKDQLKITGWRLETVDEILIEPNGYLMSEDWIVQQLTIDELTVSYRMIPDPNWFGDEELPQPFDIVMTFGRVE